MSWRKLAVLIRRLPPESATTTELRLAGKFDSLASAAAEDHDAEAEQWSRSEQLLAAVKDELMVLRYMYERSHSKHKPKWTPTPTPRPGVKPKRKRKRLTEDQVSALEAYLARTQGAPEDN